MPEFIGFADFAKLAEIEPPLPTIEGLPILVNPLFFGVLPVVERFLGRGSKVITSLKSPQIHSTLRQIVVFFVVTFMASYSLIFSSKIDQSNFFLFEFVSSIGIGVQC